MTRQLDALEADCGDGKEIRNEDDLKLVTQYAEEQKRKEEETINTDRPAPIVEMCDVPGDDDDTSTEDEDIVKNWCSKARRDVVGGGLSGSDDDLPSDEDRKGKKDKGKGKGKSANNGKTVPARRNSETSAEDEPMWLKEQKQKEVDGDKPKKEKPVIPLKAQTAGNVMYPEIIARDSVIKHVGAILNIAHGGFTVKGIEGSPPMDLQSLLCLKNRSVLGVIVDTFGPIKSPHYVLYLTSSKVLVEANGPLEDLIGEDVFYVSEESSFALDEDNLNKAMAGLSIDQLALEDECSGDSSGDDTPEADESWLRQNYMAFGA